MAEKEEVVRTFIATDAAGARYTVRVIQKFIRTSGFGDHSEPWTPGLKRLETAEGVSLDPLDSGRYRTRDGMILTSNDPSAD